MAFPVTPKQITCAWIFVSGEPKLRCFIFKCHLKFRALYDPMCWKGHTSKSVEAPCFSALSWFLAPAGCSWFMSFIVNANLRFRVCKTCAWKSPSQRMLFWGPRSLSVSEKYKITKLLLTVPRFLFLSVAIKHGHIWSLFLVSDTERSRLLKSPH